MKIIITNDRGDEQSRTDLADFIRHNPELSLADAAEIRRTLEAGLDYVLPLGAGGLFCLRCEAPEGEVSTLTADEAGRQFGHDFDGPVTRIEWPDRLGWYEQTEDGRFLVSVFHESEDFDTEAGARAFLYSRAETFGPVESPHVAQHTPGPWTAHQPEGRDNPASKWIISAGEDYSVATVHNHVSHDWAGANASLIAAAPRLLAMVEKLRAAAMDTPALDSSEDWTALIDEANSAIAQAKGTK